MIVPLAPPKHLTYCLNVHPGEHWEQNLAAVASHALKVRDRVAPGQPFGLGLRLSRAACDELGAGDRLDSFRAFLSENNLYVFTINGFPYGAFHNTAVKQDVYAPDWRTEERLTYTNRLASILAALLPEGVPGSVSTVPGAYREWIRGDADRDALVTNLAACARHLASIEETDGKLVMLALEPEPDCLFDTTDGATAFFNDLLDRHPALRGSGVDWRRYLGVCLDACHMAVQFENPADSLAALRREGIAVSKVHVSAALRASTGPDTAAALGPFAEGTYLHQVRLRREDGVLLAWPDISPEALAAVREPGGEVRVHVHVPLYIEGTGVLRSTADTLSPAFFRTVVEHPVPHLEVETYTFNILPPELAYRSIDESIAAELQWTLEGLRPHVLCPA